MRNTTFSILFVLFSIFLSSCSNHKEVSKTEFINTVLPKVDVNYVEIKNNEKILVHTVEEETYKVNAGSMTRGEINEFVDTIRARNEHISVHQETILGSNHPGRYLLDFIPFIFPLLFIIHIILLWIALKRIIRSNIDSMEKLVYTIISIFFPFFGPILYLTTGKKHR